MNLLFDYFFLGSAALSSIVYFFLYFKARKVPYFLLGLAGMDVFLILGALSEDGFLGLLSYDMSSPLSYAFLGQNMILFVTGLQFLKLEMNK